jgi:hypothetical protein
MLPEWLSDTYLFPVLQALLALIFLFSVAMEVFSQVRAGFGSVSLSLERGAETMKIFYGFYLALSGLLVALCMGVEMAKEHRVIWVVLDVLIVSYLCLVNPWFRNGLVGIAVTLRKLERR